MFGNLAAIINAMTNEYTPPADARAFRKSKHSAGQRRKADPRKKKLRKISSASRRRNRG